MASRTFWTRINRFGCPCPSCSTSSALNGSASSSFLTAGRKTYRSSTLSYTVAVGFATAVEGVRKTRRRKQLEGAIADKKKEVERLDASIDKRRKKLPNAVVGKLPANAGNDWKTLLAAADWEKSFTSSPKRARKEVHLAETAREQQSWSRLSFYNVAEAGEGEFPAVPVIPSTHQLYPYLLPPQSPWAPMGIRKMVKKSTTTKKKLYGIELCMARLVLQLCIATKTSGLTEDELSEIPGVVHSFAILSTDEAEALAQELELELTSLILLDSGDIPLRHAFTVSLPQYQDTTSMTNIMQEAFNTRLRSLCETVSSGESTTSITKSVLKICEHIINSRVAPDLKAINQLLITFKSWDRPDLSKATIGVLYDGRFRPNEITCAFLLNFHRQAKDERRFLECISLMHGARSGMMLARPWAKTFHKLANADGPTRQIISGNKVIQAVVPSALIYLEMITGLTQFVGLEKTWAFCNRLSYLNWGYDYACIYLLLFRSAVESTTALYQQVWEQAQKLAAVGHRIPKSLYALMVAIHKLEKEQDQAWFVFEDGLTNHPEEEANILRMVHDRMKLILQTRIAKSSEKEDEYRRIEEEYRNTLLQKLGTDTSKVQSSKVFRFMKT